MKRKTKMIVLVVCLLVAVAGYLWIKPYYTFFTKTLDISPFKILFPGNTVQTVDDQVGIVMLGIAGGTHDGPNLSDSIIVVNYNTKTNVASTIGVPRDVWSETLQDKINSAYAYGEAKQKGGGIKLAKAEIGGIVGIPIEYAVVINFDKFKELVDYLGGIEVNVQHSFTDTEYPLDGKENDLCGGDPDFKCRYETITFTKGISHMDGTTALKFVRSRHAQGSEGSDFARSQRQQLVLQAVKNEALAIVKTGNIEKISQLYDKVNSLLVRDLSNQQGAILAKNIIFHKNFTLNSTYIPEQFFYVPDYSQYNGAYVLVPVHNDSNTLHSYVRCLIEKGQNGCASLVPKPETDNP